MEKTIKEYDLNDVLLYINWLYFFHAWGLNGSPRQDRLQLADDAWQMLKSWMLKYQTHAIFALFEANSDGDDLVVEGVRFPMLRQQHPTAPGEPNLCLADFIRPQESGMVDHIGVFCASMDPMAVEEYKHDEYLGMLAQTLSDRLAEATVEKLHEEVRRKLWGYVPDEQLSIEEMLRGAYQGIRPAIGYPSLPDTSANFIIDQLIDMKQIGIRLTETGMMMPHASVSGLMFAHPKARYFELGKIGEDQLRDYARRRGVPVELMRTFLQSSLLKK